jgi:hypothetical protein
LRWGAALVAAGGCILPGAAQDIIALRGFRELPPSAVEYLATKVEPTAKVVPAADSTIRKMLVDHCGDVLKADVIQVLAKEFHALNKEQVSSPALDTPLPGGLTLRLPFCAPVHGNKIVPLGPGITNLEQAVKFQYPLYGEVTVGATADATRRLTGKGPGQLRQGDQIKVVLSAPWVQGQVRRNENAKDILATLTSFAPLYRENIAKNSTSTDTALQYVGSLSTADLKGTDSCNEPSVEEEGKWPINRGALDERLKEARTAYATRNSGAAYKPSHVAIIDSGMSEELFNKLRAAKFLWTNNDEMRFGENNKSDDDNAIVDDFHGIGAASVTEGRFLAFIDADTDQRSHGSKVARTIFGGAPMLDALLAASEGPPVQISFLRASWRLETGTVRPLPTFIPIAMTWLKNKDVAAVNLSMWHLEPQDEQYGQLNNSALFVAAAGNDGVDIEEAETKPYPAYRGGMTREPYITVGAHHRGFGKLARSNFSKTKVDLLAPGCAIPVLDERGKKVYGIGTSYAAPLVTMTAGMLRSLGIRDPRAMRNRIVASANFDVNLMDVVWSGGTLDIPKAVSVYHDIVDIRRGDRRAAAHERETLYGDLLVDNGPSATDELARFCNDAKVRAKLKQWNVVKMSRYVDGQGNNRVVYFADNRSSDRTLVRRECGWNARETHLRFKVRMPGREETVEVFSIADIVDVVPRTFP